MRIVIIGANSAVAKAIAKLCAQRGDELFLLARCETALQATIKDLGHSVKGSYCYDFCDTSQAEKAVNAAVGSLGEIDVALVAHGYLPVQEASESSMEILERCFSVNFSSVIALLMPLQQQMLQQDKGKIAVISSVAGDRGRPRNFTYGAAKGALSLYLQGLRSVLYGSGVEVYDFKMGPVDSPMTVDHTKNFSFSSTDSVASIMLKALSGKRYCVYVPGYWRWVMLVVRVMPECVFQRLGFLSDR